MTAPAPRGRRARLAAAFWKFVVAASAGCAWWSTPPPEFWPAIAGYADPPDADAPPEVHCAPDEGASPAKLTAAERRAWKAMVARW